MCVVRSECLQLELKFRCKMIFIILLTTGLSGILLADTKFYEGKESWGYVNVRKDAYMFWWLFCKEVDNYRDYPLIIWLQGGPGASSTGYGNFMEIGPLDEYLHPRNTSWVQKANVLFLDNPVGTGYSYVTNTSALATNNEQIAKDLLTTLTSVLENLPEFQKSSLYIFGESYGGKMAVDFSIMLYQAIKDGKLVCNFKGVALGDSFISPFDSVASWGPYLYTMSLAQDSDLKSLDAQLNTLKKYLAARQYENATQMYSTIQESIENFTNNVDWYNILKREGTRNLTSKVPKDRKNYKLYHRQSGYFQDTILDDLMNGKIKAKLHVVPKNVTWNSQSPEVFAALTRDFMKPVIDSVNKLLNETTLSINVYSGQLDLIVNALGTMHWVENLKWPGLKDFMKLPRHPMMVSNNTGGFSKSFKNFSFYWILRAGHMVPQDAGTSALQMLDMIISSNK